jgi:hypothetical protein
MKIIIRARNKLFSFAAFTRGVVLKANIPRQLNTEFLPERTELKSTDEVVLTVYIIKSQQ